jgi:hypothetical protein
MDNTKKARAADTEPEARQAAVNSPPSTLISIGLRLMLSNAGA